MRIAYLINRYPAVSHSFIRREILALERLGHEIVRISIRAETNNQLSAEDQSEMMRTRFVLRCGALALFLAFVRVLTMSPTRLVKALRLTWKLGWRAERPLPVHVIYLVEACQILLWTRAEKAEHLHAHFGTNSAEVAMLVHELGGPPWSFTVHGPEEFDKAPFIALPEKIRRADFVVAISSFGRSQLFRHVGHDQWSKIKVVRCGIERAFYEGVEASHPISARRLLCVGRLCEQKGQLLLIEASKKLVEAGIAFELVLAGDGAIRAEIERLIQTYQITSTVRITGWITSAQVREEIMASRALVLPSFAEGLPVVIMEAMALQRPVISTFVAGIPELVESGEHGWLVPAGDVDALAAAMQRCLESPADVIRTIGVRAQAKVLRFHDVDHGVAQLAELFRLSQLSPEHPVGNSVDFTSAAYDKPPS
jgi:glycosyltransferase involved in cell wall biosynthesis